MKAFKYLVFLLFCFFSTFAYSAVTYSAGGGNYGTSPQFSTKQAACSWFTSQLGETITFFSTPVGNGDCRMDNGGVVAVITIHEDQKCEAGIGLTTLKVPASSGKMVCVQNCQYSLIKCVDVDFEAGMTCDGVNEGRECGTPPPTTTPTTPPVTQDPTNPTDKTEEQKTFENIMHVIGEKLDGIKDAITGGNQNQDGGDTGGSTGGNTGSEVNVNVDMSETNAKIDETNSLIDELTKWLQGEDLGDDIFGDQEPPEKELTPQQLDTSIFSSRSQCPADARLSFNLLGGKSFTKTFEFKDWCDNLEIFGSLILIASYLFGAYIIVSKS